ncbi:hypothetical protein LOK49_LG12G02993 [Camellia lanceoleosa]|uniref:Uncharacterized protein n=1 Tax=Camellia lanceoleosa TaxID=1840588 RepID=A0ACC0FTS7_9ERIC|nr:hypothetical protein LOK49_LG12G02993 [Camellia lanceoleosa]
MAGPSHLKIFHSLKSPSSSSTLTFMKLKTLVHSLILSHLCRISRALAKAKSLLIQVLEGIQLIQFTESLKKNKNKNKNKNKLFFGSFRLHYNWCSSHVVPVPSPVLDRFPTSHMDVYYDSTWNSIVSKDCDDIAESELPGYLQWLEEKVVHKNSGGADDINEIEIDKLADMFITSCHEKFMLEKQESYRRFQEMMARSV